MTLALNDRIRQARPGTFLVRFGVKALALAAELCRRRKTRQALARLKPRDLRDIGLTPNDVKSACAGPLARDAATELHYIARLRSGNW